MSSAVVPVTPARTRFSGLAWPALVLVIAGLLVVGCGGHRAASPRTTSSPTLETESGSVTTETTTPTTTTPTPPPTPQVGIQCSTGTAYSNYQQLTMDVGGDFAAIWAVNPISCVAHRDSGALTPLEQQAFTAAGYPTTASLATLYGLCAEVDPNNVYLQSSHTLTPPQINEVNGMLTLCPNHPQATQLRETASRSQAENAAEAAGELIHAGTFLVNTEIKPGTYVVEGLIENCYWERTDATGAIIDNAFIPGARRVQVTIRSTDYSFHNEGCGKWLKVS